MAPRSSIAPGVFSFDDSRVERQSVERQNMMPKLSGMNWMFGVPSSSSLLKT